MAKKVGRSPIVHYKIQNILQVLLDLGLYHDCLNIHCTSLVVILEISPIVVERLCPNIWKKVSHFLDGIRKANILNRNYFLFCLGEFQREVMSKLLLFLNEKFGS